MTRLATALKYMAARIFNLAMWLDSRAGTVSPGPSWPADPNWTR